VRVHTGSQAESMNRQVNAQAFAHGNDIYFNSGKYSPDTSSGGLLLAHELTHTIQQGASKHVSTPASSSIATKKIVTPKRAVQKSADQLGTTTSHPIISSPKEANDPEINELHRKGNSVDSNGSISSGNSTTDNPSLSNWSIGSNGKIHLSNASPGNNPENKLQLAENESKEKEEDRGTAVQTFVQKKYDHSIQTKQCAECRSGSV